MLTKKVYEVRTHCDNDPWQGEDLPEVPVLPETLLCLELYTYQQFSNLDALAELILSDLGATIQVIRLANRECSFVDGLSVRIEDCISALGLQRCLDALSGQIFIRSGQWQMIRRTWNHARAIGQRCMQIAEEHCREIRPRDAYLVGLLHELDALPVLLNWQFRGNFSRNSGCAGIELATEWSLPACVLEYLMELRDQGSASRWTELLTQAHQIPEGCGVPCLRMDQASPRIPKRVHLQQLAL